jgi:hypothetical protein
MPYTSKPGTRKMGDNPLEKRSCYTMKGFSGFGNSPVPKMDPMHNGKPGVQKEDFAQFKSSPATKASCSNEGSCSIDGFKASNKISRIKANINKVVNVTKNKLKRNKRKKRVKTLDTKDGSHKSVRYL